MGDRRHRDRARQPPLQGCVRDPVERMSEFVDEPAGGVLKVEPL
jgi:hypothetical protein